MTLSSLRKIVDVYLHGCMCCSSYFSLGPLVQLFFKPVQKI